VLIAWLLTAWPYFLNAFLVAGFWPHTLISFVVSVLAAPVTAIVAAVLYYRLSDPVRPVPSRNPPQLQSDSPLG
jgi:hypothetical protein